MLDSHSAIRIALQHPLTRTATSVLKLAPCGGGLGRGVERSTRKCATPTPDPSPQGGGERKHLALLTVTSLTSRRSPSSPSPGRFPTSPDPSDTRGRIAWCG